MLILGHWATERVMFWESFGGENKNPTTTKKNWRCGFFFVKRELGCPREASTLDLPLPSFFPPYTGTSFVGTWEARLAHCRCYHVVEPETSRVRWPGSYYVFQALGRQPSSPASYVKLPRKTWFTQNSSIDLTAHVDVCVYVETGHI
jgi:hypothetical protein